MKSPFLRLVYLFLLLGFLPAGNLFAAAPSLPQAASVDYESLQQTWGKSLNKIADAISAEDIPPAQQLDDLKDQLRTIRMKRWG